MKQVAFGGLLATSQQQGLLYRLPRWREPGIEQQDAFKLYLSDPGILHRLLRWDERIYEDGPFGVGAARHGRSKLSADGASVFASFTDKDIGRRHGYCARQALVLELPFQHPRHALMPTPFGHVLRLNYA